MSTSIETTDITPQVRYGVHNSTAVIQFGAAPDFAVDAETVAGISSALTMALEDEAVESVLIAGDGPEFGTSSGAPVEGLAELTGRISGSQKPVTAVIHGQAKGAAFELALACQRRIADADAQLGLPDIALGLVPSAGSTQRLPRMIGVEAAIDLIRSGRIISGAEAAQLGIIDAVYEGDPLEAGLQQAPLAEGTSFHDAPKMASEVDFAAARAGVRRNDRNALAQLTAIDCIEAASHVPFDEGLVVEQQHAQRLAEGPESAALHYVAQAEQDAITVDDVPATTATRSVEKVAVIGAGTMGGGISMSFINAGIPVTIIEQNQDNLDRGLATIKRNYDISASRGRMSAADVTERMGRLTPSLNLEDAADADLVIEAVFEDMQLKKEIFGRLDEICKPGAILASNTSRLSIDEIASATKRPADVIGMHFFSPANVMALLEVVRGDATADDVIATCMQLARRIGKAPVISRVCDGFIGNRMLSYYRRQVDAVLADGATPQQIDNALTGFGMAMGPFAMADLAGLDIGWAARKRANDALPESERVYTLRDRLCEAGRFGQKNGLGYYRYEEGSRTPIPDPFVEEVMREQAAAEGRQLREVEDDEIVERSMLALTNEAAKILDEGIAQRASDIDVVYVNGYGFPGYRGGPMYYAGQLGLDVVLEKIKSFHEQYGDDAWTPAPLIERLVAEGKTTF